MPSTTPAAASTRPRAPPTTARCQTAYVSDPGYVSWCFLDHTYVVRDSDWPDRRRSSSRTATASDWGPCGPAEWTARDLDTRPDGIAPGPPSRCHCSSWCRRRCSRGGVASPFDLWRLSRRPLHDTSYADRARLADELGLRDPWWATYGQLGARAAVRPTGVSRSFGQPVATVIGERAAVDPAAHVPRARPGDRGVVRARRVVRRAPGRPGGPAVTPARPGRAGHPAVRALPRRGRGGRALAGMAARRRSHRRRNGPDVRPGVRAPRAAGDRAGGLAGAVAGDVGAASRCAMPSGRTPSAVPGPAASPSGRSCCGTSSRCRWARSCR